MARKKNIKKVYRECLAEALDGGNWFQFFRPYYYILPDKATALFLQDLMNLARQSKRMTNDGWFQCSTDYLEGGGWSRREQVRHLKVLTAESRKFVQVEKRGTPPRRWVRINLTKIARKLDKIKTTGRIKVRQSTPRGVDCSTPRGVDSIKNKRIKKNPDATHQGAVPAASRRAAPPAVPNQQTGNARLAGGIPHLADSGKVMEYAASRLVPSPRPSPLRPQTCKCPSPPEDAVSAPRMEGCGQPAKPRGGRPLVTAQDSARTQKLQLHVVASSKHPLPPSDNDHQRFWRWEGSMARLRERLESCATQIDSVLDYLVNHHPKDAAPKIRNAKQFADQFDWLKDLADRYAARNPVLVITDEAKKLAHHLGEGWPKGCDPQIPMTVQLSLDACRDFQARVKRATTSGNGRSSAFARHVLASMSYPRNFVEEYMYHLLKRLTKWRDWGGNLVRLAFRPDGKDFDDQGRSWASDWCGDPDFWSRFLKEVYS